jgi:hypothetical protein
MRIYLDDQFNPVGTYLLIAPRMGNEREIYLRYDWDIVRSFKEMVEAVTAHALEITHISFDFDLDQYPLYEGDTGKNCAEWVKWFYESSNLTLPKIYIHSRNYYGTENIRKTFPIAIY